MKSCCQYPDCTEERKSICEICDTHFCEDHGSPHQPLYGTNDDIAICWKCGGYNADE